MAKVLWITECYPSNELPQYCVFLEQQVKALIKLGHKIDIFMPIRNGDEHKLISEIYNEVNIYKIGYHTDKFNLFFSKGTKSLRNEVEELVKKQNYDILAMHIASEAIYHITGKIANKFNIKYILTFHGLNIYQDYYVKNNLLNKFYYLRKKFLFSKADAIIGVSKKVKNIIEKEVRSVPVFYVYNGVDIDLFSPKAKKSNNNEEIKIVSIGNLIPIKGFNYLIDAIGRLVHEGIKINVSILGGGKEEETLKEQVKILDISNNVKFIGYKPYNIVKDYLQESDIFILPSYFEAIGCVYLEAMACGIATIGVKNQGIDEIIKDGYNGLLVEPRSVESIYQKLKLLIGDRNLREKISKNGRKTIEHFTWEESAKNIEKIYYEVLER